MEASSAPSFVPRNNQEYGTHEYWEHRFRTETSFEWLLSFTQLRHQLEPILHEQYDREKEDPSTVRILIVGCGNSPFSADLYDAGYTNIVNIDYSDNVIQHMQQLHSIDRPQMQWRVMDMTDLSSFPDASFDVVLDKAAMDALLTQEGDVWHPQPECIAAVYQMCAEVSRVLTPSQGSLVQISLSPPHFRKKYLLHQHTPAEISPVAPAETRTVTSSDDDHPNDCGPWNWTLHAEPAGRPEDTAGCFGHYLYVLRRRRLSQRSA
jgi:EEF1A lysine methyltransferase 4